MIHMIIYASIAFFFDDHMLCIDYVIFSFLFITTSQNLS